jgi:hypothetical protein
MMRLIVPFRHFTNASGERKKSIFYLHLQLEKYAVRWHLGSAALITASIEQGKERKSLG